MTNALVVDCSAVVALLLAKCDETRGLRSLLADRTLYAPELLDIEVMSVLRRLNRAGEVGDEQANALLLALIDFPAVRVAHLPLLRTAWSMRENVSAYDASYVALAMRLPATLVTADSRLARAIRDVVNVELI
ncbi:MAG TPA: type II toxin-antitoxin system VapC family toxin [Aeromicrobium sp.]|nr:type II toxin-antitoxin system VapC family toxin [Aeromicrobium sp.]